MREPLGNRLRMYRDTVVTRHDGERFQIRVLDPCPSFPIQVLETAAMVRHVKCQRRKLVRTEWYRQPRWVARAEAFDFMRDWIADHVCPTEGEDMPTLKPATPEDAISRRNTLFAAYVEKVFQAMKKNGATPVSLSGPLGARSEILLGLRKPGETNEQAQARIAASFAFHYPLIAASGAVAA